MTDKINDDEICKKICSEMVKELSNLFVKKIRELFLKEEISHSDIYMIIVNTMGNFIYEVNYINNKAQGIEDKDEIKERTANFLTEIVMVVHGATSLNNNKQILND